MLYDGHWDWSYGKSGITIRIYNVSPGEGFEASLRALLRGYVKVGMD